MTKVILITGASSGIGENLALEWSKHKDVSLILAARNREALEKIRLLCETNGAKASVVELDLSNGASIENAVKEIESKFGSPDVVVHNGGISQRSFTQDTNMDVYRRLMEVNFFGTVHLTKLFLPKMLERKSGQFVVVTSVMGKVGTPFRSGYAASKHALHGFFDCLRAEVSKNGIEVTMICPGFVNTPLTMSALSGDGSKYNKLDPFNKSGMDPEVFSRKMIAAIEAKKEEVFIGGPKEGLALFMKRLAPGILNKMVAKMKVT